MYDAINKWVVAKSKTVGSPLFLSQQDFFTAVSAELFDQLPDASKDLRDQKPRSAAELTSVLQILHTLGVVLYAQRAGLVCMQPPMLPQVWRSRILPGPTIANPPLPIHCSDHVAVCAL